MMKKTLFVAMLLVGVGICHAQGPLPFEGSDNFAGASKDPLKWGDNIFNGPGLLTQTGGVLKFSCAIPSGADETHFMAWPWMAYGPMISSWSVQADVNVPVIALPDDDASVGVGVVVRNALDGTDLLTMQLENSRSKGQPQSFNFFSNIQINDVESERSIPAPTGKLLSVRIAWNADTQTLTAQYDSDGPANGYSWQTLNSFNPVLDGWDMTFLDSFEIAVVGAAEKIAVTNAKNVYLDNFLISPLAPENLAGSDNFNDNARDVAKWGTDFTGPDQALTEVNGRLEYTTTKDVDGSAERPWIANTGSYVEDWEAFAEVHVSDFAASDGGLAVILAAKTMLGSAQIRLDLEKSGDVPTRMFQWINDGPGTPGTDVPAPSGDAALRVAFDATEKVLSFYYDSNGAVGGFNWTEIGSVDVDDPNDSWGLMEDSRFLITLGGVSTGLVVASGEAYADNFNSISPYEPFITDSPNAFDKFTSIGKNLQNWGQVLENGTADLVQSGDGVLRFTAAVSGPDDDSMEAWFWQANGSFGGNWSVQADVHLPVIPLAAGGGAAGLGLAVLNSADDGDVFTVQLENFKDPGQPQEFHYFSNIDVNGNDLPEISAPSNTTLGAIRLSWDAAKKLLTSYYDADGPQNGYRWTVLTTYSPAGAANWNMTSGNSFRIALFGSAEQTQITESHGFYADNFYVFGATTTLLPIVKTTAATDIVHDSANVHGTVDAKNSPRAVFVDWGLTTSYGSTMPASPAVADGTSTTVILGQLVGLMPHTKYNYRIRAGSALGTASGANMTFTTLDRAPVGVANPSFVLPGATVTLNVLANDTDPDGDALSIKSNTALVPASAGKLTKSGNNLIFTAAANFSGAATFTYIAKDAFGMNSAATTVTLSLGNCTLTHAQVFPLPSAGTQYDVNVKATGAWSVIESASWISAAPLSAADDGVVQITLQPNTALTSRTATVMIGGQAHVITQAGVLLPDIELAVDPPPPGVVGGLYDLDIVTTNPPVTYTVTNLPPGLSLNQANGKISGRPTKAATFNHVKVSAKNAKGSAPTVLDFTIDVAPLNPSFVGVFNGLVTPNPILNDGFGSRFEMTTTSTGGVSGKIITGAATVSFKGALEPDANNLDVAVFSVPIAAGPGASTLDIAFDPLIDGFTGTISDLDTNVTPVTGWRNPWKTGHKATAYAALHTFSLEPPPPDPIIPTPEGFGYGSFKPNDGTGAVTVTGKLPDNTTFTSTTFIGEYGQLLIYAPLYGNKGCVSGIVTVAPNDEADLSDNEVSCTLDWFKFPSAPTAKDTVYPMGIFPLQLLGEGGAYLGIPAGGLVMDLPAPPSNAMLMFSGAQLTEEVLDFDATFDISNPSPTGLTNKAVFSTDVALNPNKVSMATLNAATGAFSGEFTLPGATTAENRKITFQGQIVRDPLMGTMVGRGYCLVPMPIFPPFVTAANAMKTSSRVELVPGP